MLPHEWFKLTGIINKQAYFRTFTQSNFNKMLGEKKTKNKQGEINQWKFHHL